MPSHKFPRRRKEKKRKEKKKKKQEEGVMSLSRKEKKTEFLSSARKSATPRKKVPKPSLPGEERRRPSFRKGRRRTVKPRYRAERGKLGTASLSAGKKKKIKWNRIAPRADSGTRSTRKSLRSSRENVSFFWDQKCRARERNSLAVGKRRSHPFEKGKKSRQLQSFRVNLHE